MRPEDRLAALLEAEASGRLPKFLLFWGHRPERDGSTGKGCLSQWWPAPFTIDGTSYPTAEHWMMAGKARLFGDDEALERVLASAEPGAAKAAGRTVKGFDEMAWDAHRYDLVVAGNRAKFGQHADLGGFLLRTGDKVLVEASPTDRVWGIGLAAADAAAAATPSRWRGTNLLGFALMDVRDDLRRRGGSTVSPSG